MDDTIWEHYKKAVDLLKKLGIDPKDFDNEQDLSKLVHDNVNFNSEGIYIPQLGYYFDDKKEAITVLLELAQDEYKYFDNERLIDPIFSGKLEFQHKPHLENRLNGYITPCSEDEAQEITNFCLEIS